MNHLVAVALLVSLLAAPAATADASLKVTLDDTLSQVSPGDEVQYVAVFENAGGSPFDGVASLSPPPFLSLEADGATESGGQLRWEVSLAPGERFEATATGTIGHDVGAEYQVVVLASLAAADSPDVVLARAADADLLAGAAAPAPVPGMQEPEPAFPWSVVLASGAGLAVLAVVLVLVLVLRRRFSGRPGAP